MVDDDRAAQLEGNEPRVTMTKKISFRDVANKTESCVERNFLKNEDGEIHLFSQL